LQDLVRNGQRLSWSNLRPLLEQLTDELNTAVADETLPDLLTVDQVWVKTNGQAVLLDMPLASPAAEPVDDRLTEILTLLRQVVSLALEGKVRGETEPSRPIAAPLPLHAQKLLNDLLQGKLTLDTWNQFVTALRATRDQPTEVTRPRRTAHLALVTGLILFCLFIYTSPAGWFARFGSAMQALGHSRERRWALEDLQAVAEQEHKAAQQSPDLKLREQGRVQWIADFTLMAQLRLAMIRDEEEKQRQVRAMGPICRMLQTRSEAMLIQVEESIRSQRKQQGGPQAPDQVRRRARSWSMVSPAVRDMDELGTGQVIWLCSWPVVWMVWTFLMRGGVPYRPFRLALVRDDGRSASRLQSVYRALIVWGPVTGLLLLSLWLDSLYMSLMQEGDPYRWLIWESSFLWWSGLLLLVAYVILTIRSPTRALYDRIAGTYVVPR
jgi:hypothetical protein